MRQGDFPQDTMQTPQFAIGRRQAHDRRAGDGYNDPQGCSYSSYPFLRLLPHAFIVAGPITYLNLRELGGMAPPGFRQC